MASKRTSRNARALKHLAGCEKRDSMLRDIKRLASSLQVFVKEALFDSPLRASLSGFYSRCVYVSPDGDVAEMIVSLAVDYRSSDKGDVDYTLHIGKNSYGYARLETARLSFRRLKTVYQHLDNLIELAELICGEHNRLDEFRELRALVVED